MENHIPHHMGSGSLLGESGVFALPADDWEDLNALFEGEEHDGWGPVLPRLSGVPANSSSSGEMRLAAGA